MNIANWRLKCFWCEEISKAVKWALGSKVLSIRCPYCGTEQPLGVVEIVI